ncbi:Uncharacterized protein HZ326_30545, partial [Fusarium oxysporum f. sp. albedinis]
MEASQYYCVAKWHSRASTTSLPSRFRRSVMVILAPEKSRSGSADIAGIDILLYVVPFMRRVEHDSGNVGRRFISEPVVLVQLGPARVIHGRHYRIVNICLLPCFELCQNEIHSQEDPSIASLRFRATRSMLYHELHLVSLSRASLRLWLIGSHHGVVIASVVHHEISKLGSKAPFVNHLQNGHSEMRTVVLTV